MTRVFTITLNPAIDQTLLLQTLVPGAVHRAQVVQHEAGGKGMGVAAVLAALGIRVSAGGWLGAGNADLFEAAFAARGIADIMLRIPGHTRVNIKLADAARGVSTDINLPGISLSPEALVQAEADLLDRLGGGVQAGDWCVLAGSLPPGVGPGTWARLARRLAACGARLVFDTGGGVLRELLQELATCPGALPVFLKPNCSELEAFARRRLATPTEVCEAARELQDHGVAQVIVSLGSEGAVVVAGGQCWLARPPSGPVVTTVGAGDALVAGTLAALSEGARFSAAARFGMACAAARIQHIAPELPSRAELNALAARIDLLAI